MNAKERQSIKRHLQQMIELIDGNNVDWVAVSVRLHSGATLAIHTNRAPKRPRGLS